MRHIYLFLILALAGFQMQGQRSAFSKGDALYGQLSYAKAIASYEHKLSKHTGLVPTDVLLRLADSYYYTSNLAPAVRYYQNALGQSNASDLSSDHMFRYAHSLQGTGATDKAKEWLTKYYELRPEYSNDASNLSKILEKTADYDLKVLSLNSPLSDFGVSFYGDRIIYASASHPELDIDLNASSKDAMASIEDRSDLYAWTNQPFLNLYTAQVDAMSLEGYNVRPFSDYINTDYHEAAAVFTKDLDRVYFTRNNSNLRGSRLKFDRKSVSHLKLFTARNVGRGESGKWSDAVSFPYNSDDYSVGHPALSPDGTKLYFVSDMPGGYGGTDIYVVDILEDNTFSEPRNLGEAINTPSKELFPYISKEGTLYFSSEGHLGFGGLDVFSSAPAKEDGGFTAPENMGAPINSPKDDFGFIYNKEKDMGYLSSNRVSGKGDDDIYSLRMQPKAEKAEKEIKEVPVVVAPKEIPCKQYIYGTLSSAATKAGLSGVSVSLYDESNQFVEQKLTDAMGGYSFDNQLACQGRYKVTASKEGYSAVQKQVVLPSTLGTTEVSAALSTVDELIVEREDAQGLKIKIDNIYFDLNKSYIRKDAALELEKVLRVMNKYPSMVIKIESHTDARSSDQYNRSLSDRRAKSTKAYLEQKGIAQGRIESAIGYGESRLLNHCSNGVKCSETQHQQNRRSEFVILKM